MRDRYSQHFIIPCYETDGAQLLKPASFMDFAQEAANRHADILGFGYDDLSRTKTLWVLSRMHVRFRRHPKWREEVNFETWHKGPLMMFYLRDFLMTGTDGSVLVEATSSWLVIDADTRRIVRGTDSLMDGGTAGKRDAIAEPCGKVQMPKGVEPESVADHTVSYSDVDLNGHANNAMYLVWAMDAVEFAVTSGRPLKEFKINFNHETRPGDVISLCRVRHEEPEALRYIVEGTCCGKQAFCAELVF